MRAKDLFTTILLIGTAAIGYSENSENLSLGENIEHTYNLATPDSIKISHLLLSAPENRTTGEYIFHFGQQLAGTPYVAKTLEVNATEQLVVNLREMDCTTFVENCLALALCCSRGERSVEAFTRFLRLIRYKDGIVSYPTRNHYFTRWALENERSGFVADIATDSIPFAAVQTVDVHYMSQHPDSYPALAADASLITLISTDETELTGLKLRYIPSVMLHDSNSLRQYIKNGDIISLQTSTDGLDTSHLGIASWHDDGELHLLNCSSIYKKVVDDSEPLHSYMAKKTSRIGIRVLRAK